MRETPVDENNELAFYEVARRFRAAHDPSEIKKLGDELGRRIFGDEDFITNAH